MSKETMNTEKICRRCKESKDISLFKQRKGKPDSYCKKCASEMQVEQSRTIDGLVTSIYAKQRYRSNKKGWDLPDYSKEDFYAWVTSQQEFVKLYTNWVDSNYDTDKIPSVDRKDDNNPYTINNIQLMTWESNNKKGREDRVSGANVKGSKPIYQYTLEGTFVKKFGSTSIAAREYNTSPQNLRACATGKNTHAVNFIWKFENCMPFTGILPPHMRDN